MVQWQIIAFDYIVRLDNFGWYCIYVNVCIRNEMKTLLHCTFVCAVSVLQCSNDFPIRKSRDKERKFDSRSKNKSNQCDKLAMCRFIHTRDDFYFDHGVFCDSWNCYRYCKYRYAQVISESHNMTHIVWVILQSSLGIVVVGSRLCKSDRFRYKRSLNGEQKPQKKIENESSLPEFRSLLTKVPPLKKFNSGSLGIYFSRVWSL